VWERLAVRCVDWPSWYSFLVSRFAALPVLENRFAPKGVIPKGGPFLNWELRGLCGKAPVVLYRTRGRAVREVASIAFKERAKHCPNSAMAVPNSLPQSKRFWKDSVSHLQAGGYDSAGAGIARSGHTAADPWHVSAIPRRHGTAQDVMA
jgi:hypothetical protein